MEPTPTKTDYRDIIASLGAMMSAADEGGVVATPYITFEGYELGDDFQLESIRLGRGYSLDVCGLRLCYDEVSRSWNLDPARIAGSDRALRDLNEFLCDHVTCDDCWEYESAELETDDLVDFVYSTLSGCSFYTDRDGIAVYVKDYTADEAFFAKKTPITVERAIDLLSANPSYWLDETYL